MIILDFDGVLFDDARFKKDVWRLFERFGIPRHVHQEAYQETKARHGAYRHDTHIRLIRRRMPSVDASALRGDLERLLGHSRRYLYRDARAFLAYGRKNGHALALASNGYAFQKKKVAASGIASLLDAVAVMAIPKSRMIRALARRFPEESIFFIDDKTSVLDEVKRRMPRVIAIHMLRRSGPERSTRTDAIVSTLPAARRFIERRLPRP